MAASRETASNVNGPHSHGEVATSGSATSVATLTDSQDSPSVPPGQPAPELPNTPGTAGPPPSLKSWSFRIVPSWLVSLIVHTTALLVMGLVMLPADEAPETAIVLNRASEAREEPIYTIVEPDAFVQDPPPQVADLRFRSFAAAGDPSDKASAPSADVSLASLDMPDDADAAVDTAVPTGDVLLTVVPQRRQRTVPTRGRASNLADSSDPTDQVVYAFILYDVGQLRGQAGQDAREAFEALGPDAIESLVRGLNESAYLSASCPVIVLESKVRSTLQESNDPEKYRYALANVGRGVDPRAPYASRLGSLRRQLARDAGMGMAARGSNRSSGQRNTARSQLLRKMRRQSVRALKEHLQSEEAEVRAAAAQSIGARGIKLVDELIPLLMDKEPDVRHEAHQALVRLGRGVDFGPAVGATPDEIHEAGLLWHDWHQQSRDKKGISERTPEQADESSAEKQLRLAQQLQLAGREEVAQRRFREIIAEFPGTLAAERAASYLLP